MPITIRKKDGNINLCGSGSEPILTIYDGEKDALLNYAIISNEKSASEVAEAAMIASIFVNALIKSEGEKGFGTNNIEAMYINEADLGSENTKYSARKVLNWLESDKVVTVNKKNRIRYKFTKFAYKDKKLIILYKPVVW